MYDAPGLGLAAPQIGVQKQLFVYDIDDGTGAHARQPRRSRRVGGEWVYDEGCLSIPGLYVEIVRPKEVLLRGCDLDGNEVEIEADELLARLFQHELDHLDGVLMFDRMTPEQRKEALDEWRRLQASRRAPSREAAPPPPASDAHRHSRRSPPHAAPARLPRHAGHGRAAAARRSWTPASTSRSSSPGPTSAAAGGAEPSPSPVKAAAARARPARSATASTTCSAPAPISASSWPSASSSSRHVLAELPMVNLHFSLLPRWRGAAPVERALLAGDDETGVCLMQLEEGLDTGAVYAPCRGADRSRRTTADELRADLVAVGHRRCSSTRSRGGLGRADAAGGRADLRGQDRARGAAPRLGAPGRRARPAGAPRRGVDDASAASGSRCSTPTVTGAATPSTPVRLDGSCVAPATAARAGRRAAERTAPAAAPRAPGAPGDGSAR